MSRTFTNKGLHNLERIYKGKTYPARDLLLASIWYKKVIACIVCMYKTVGWFLLLRTAYTTKSTCTSVHKFDKSNAWIHESEPQFHITDSYCS